MDGYFSRVELPRTSHEGDGYNLHQTLWQLFADRPDRERDFLFHRQRERPGTVFVVSQREPQPPDGWSVQTRPYRPQLKAGQSLVFELRANPTVARGRDGRRSARHDVVFDARRQAQARGDSVSAADAEQNAGRGWLERQGDLCGFAVAQVRVAGYERLRLRKRRASQPISLSTLDYEGVLSVADPQRLQRALLQGIGPAKAFGCGLLLVRRL